MSAAVLRGDARALPLPDVSVDLIVTSPPYFGLRSYSDNGGHYAGQIGSEATPREYVAALVECTREWMRVLKPSGSIFVNLGDSYHSGKGAPGKTTTDPKNVGRNARRTIRSPLDYGLDLPPKTLLGLPWRYALACMDELGLILRRDIIWSKPNGLPESVTDRCRSSHEYLFHLVRQPRYYAAVDEIREPHMMRPQRRPNGRPEDLTPRQGQPKQTWPTAQRDEVGVDGHPLGKLPGSVWEIPSAPLVVPESLGISHFAAYPPELCRRIILGWSPPGICTACGEGRRPVTALASREPNDRLAIATRARTATARGTHVGSTLGYPAATADRAITGYACACPQPSAPTRPAVVVDPFGGTGTTALVASMYGRAGFSFDLSGDYCRLARWRTADPAERARALGVPKPPPVPNGQGSLFDLEDAG